MKKKATTIKKQVEKAKHALANSRIKTMPIPGKDFIGTGSTQLNLACSDRAFGGFAKGKYYFFVGDSSSGKTWFTLTCLAEAARNPEFDNYRFIYDATSEDGAQMDMDYYFGKAVAERVEILYSRTIEEFYYNIDTALRGDQPVIYILDSENGLESEDAQEKFDKQKAAYEAGKEVSGTYGMEKPKIHSRNMPRVTSQLRDTGSILIVTSQTRDNVDPFSFKKKTRSGGRALKFWATLEMWTSVIKNITREIKGKKRHIGTQVEIKIEKNRFTGKNRSVVVTFHPGVGIDDVGSCVDYLVDEQHWKKTKAGIDAHDFDVSLAREALIRHIEDMELEEELSKLCGRVWREIEEACEVQRKRRYE